jgi:hypothetical protein
MRDDSGIRFESLRLYLELPQSLLSGFICPPGTSDLY